LKPKKVSDEQIFKNMIMKLQRNIQGFSGEDDSSPEMCTIYFRIVDKKADNLVARKDSLLEYVNQKDRTYSQVASLG